MFKYDTHVHTWEVSPCGKVKASELVGIYKKRGYSGIVITDHYCESVFENMPACNWEEKVGYYLEGYRTACKEAQKEGMDVILGMEITFQDSLNDYLVFGIDESFLMENPELYKINLRKFREIVEEKDIMVYQAHPFRPYMIAVEPSLLDGVEVYNGNPRHDSQNHRAYSYAVENNLRMLSGTDFHQPQDMGGGIIVSERINSPEKLVRTLRNEHINLLGNTMLQMIL
ncbi:MAG: PHP domain-containing protein [Acetivibrionales bacterium]|jgi:predicted metal-dependent phosphoesterase TrpH